MLDRDELRNTAILERMEDIESIAVHPFGDGLILEIISIGEQDDISITSIEFDIREGGEKVNAREDIPSEYEEDIRKALSKKGYLIDDI